jgi:RNA polymerase sigma factor (sigma-70 family)
MLPTRRSLLSRLKRWDDQEGWQEFFNTYWKLIYVIAVKAGLGESEAQDVVQDTIIAVARQMPHFKYDPALGSFKDWLFLITRRRIADHLRREYRRVKIVDPAAGGSSRTPLLERLPDPAGAGLDEIWGQEWKRHLLDRALQRVKRQVEARHFQIFDCYVLKEWPVKDVMKAFGVASGQVYLIKHRISALLAKELKRAETEPV